MSAIATVLAEMGHQVSGSDIRRSDVITRLEALGIKVNIGHDPEVVFGCDFVTGSPAIAESNIEYQRARESDIRVLSRAETLASICKCATSIGVAGTHGKTTTSSMLTTILLSANKNPSYLIGGDVIALNRGASWSNSELFVVEADESDGTHSQLPLAATVVTNIDIDHLDHFKTQSAIERSFSIMSVVSLAHEFYVLTTQFARQFLRHTARLHTLSTRSLLQTTWLHRSSSKTVSLHLSSLRITTAKN